MQDADLPLALRLVTAVVEPVTPRLAATALLDELCSATPLLAATVTTFDPVSGQHAVLASTGYRQDVLDYLCSPAFLRDDVGYRLLVSRPQRRALCWRDVSVDYRQTPSAVQVFRPAGYGGGATARLTTRDGRYTGDVHVSSDDPALPTAGVLAALRSVVPLVATATDVTRRLGTLLADAGPEVAAAVVTGNGGVVPLPGRALPPPLEDPGAVVPGVRAWRDSGRRASTAAFYAPRGAEGHRLELTAVAGGTLVTAQPAPPPYGLSVRELEVLTLLSGGLLNLSIARRLGISERTVAHHVEHVLGKLGVPGRTAATRTAVEEGLRLLERA